jgi:hypothetical protein
MAAKRRRQPRQNVVSIKTWPRWIDRLPDKMFIAWTRDATQLSQEEALENPRLARARLLAAIKRERLKARKRRRGTR